MKTRLHHVVPHTVVECDLEQTNELFKTFGTEQWVSGGQTHTSHLALVCLGFNCKTVYPGLQRRNGR